MVPVGDAVAGAAAGMSGPAAGGGGAPAVPSRGKTHFLPSFLSIGLYTLYTASTDDP